MDAQYHKEEDFENFCDQYIRFVADFFIEKFGDIIPDNKVVLFGFTITDTNDISDGESDSETESI